MTRFAIRVEYVGTAFSGWQVQPGERTVQLVIEQALERLVQHPTRVTVSGRTDSGVHALGQVASFVTTASRSARAVRDGLNANLPSDVAVVDAWEVPEAFDPRRWSWGKHYRYRWLNRPSRSPMRADHTWHQRRVLDVEAMKVAASHLVGRHDFTSFRAAGCAAAHPIREVTRVEVARHDDEVWLDVWGNGFLRHMVRIVAGTLTEVGRGAETSEWVRAVLQAKDRDQAARTAPAAGLCLIEVRYEEGPPPWHGGGPLTLE
ncbi:MAG: tRNA pseudouridine(38-40) synthase TruA [Proteobacteria bacterium]|nr:tRNA pseudouridine(38-40) synthase TruA [Pseudomonadota bacterium]